MTGRTARQHAYRNVRHSCNIRSNRQRNAVLNVRWFVWNQPVRIEPVFRWLPGRKGHAILFAYRPHGCACREQAGGQPASWHYPLARHDEASEPRQRVAQRLEPRTRLDHPAFHASLPIACVANDRGGRGNIDHFDRFANLRYLLFENCNDRLCQRCFSAQ